MPMLSAYEKRGNTPPIGSQLHLARPRRQETSVEKGGWAVIQLAERKEASVAAAFERTVLAVRRSVLLAPLEAAARLGSYDALIQSMNLDESFRLALGGAGLKPNETSLQDALTEVFRLGAQLGVKGLDRIPVEKGVGTSMVFDAFSLTAASFIRNYLFNLIVEISSATREGIRSVVLQAFEEGGHPYEQARFIRNMIGLTSTQSQAVVNFRRMLMEGRYREALGRSLRDARYDPTLRNMLKDKASLKPEQIKNMVDRYRDRSIKHRAKTIARTETIRASVAGQQESWRQAREQGLLGDNARQKWIITSEACPLCVGITRLNAEGVSLGRSFQSEIGPISGPPAHSSCRCCTSLVFK